MGRQPRRQVYRSWVYQHFAVTVILEAVLLKVETYVARRQNTFLQFIAARTIMDLCLAAERHPEA